MINMKGHTNILLSIAITSLLLMSLSGMIFHVQAVNDSGGTDDDIEVDGDSGGGFEWNELHGFVMIEDGIKVNEKFNITLCTMVKWKNDGEDGPNYYASGYNFTQLNGIYWDDDPEPSHIIPREELDAHKSDDDDAVNTTVYILGKYIRTGGAQGDEVRKAYKKIQVQRPNNAPKPVAMITNSDENDKGMWDNWTTIESNEHDEIVYYIDAEGIYVKFYLNASESWDKDGDNITDVRWDLDENGEFGDISGETKMNTTVYLGEGDHLLGLIVGDGNKYSEPPLDIRIVIKQPIRYPDLMIQDMQIVNKNGMEDIMKGDRCAVIAEVKNMGDLEIEQDFDVNFEYWFRDTSPDRPDWIPLGTMAVTETINVNGLKLCEVPWDTGFSEFVPGTYSFRAYADYGELITELRELNNVFPREGDEMDAQNITLMEDVELGEASISIVDVELSKTEAWVNEIVWVNITLKNDGDGDARYVDIHYFMDNTYLYYKTVDNLQKDGGEWTESFVFSGDSNGSFRVKFEVKDDGQTVATSNQYSILVEGIYNPNGGGENGDGGGSVEDDGGNEMLPLIIVAVVIVAGLGGAGFFFMKKKDEDVW